MSFNRNEDNAIPLTYDTFIKHLYKKTQDARQFRDGNFSVKSNKEFGDLVIVDDVSITFDSWNPHADVIFISHAHTDHIPIIPKAHIEELYRSRKSPLFICSKITKEVAETRTAKRFRFPEHLWLLGNSSNYPQSTNYNGITFSLIENGHAYGSTSLIIEGSEKILYTGDFITEDRIFSGKKTSLFGLKPVKCDRLIVECTFGSPEYIFPSFQKLQIELNKCIQEQINHGNPVILLGYAFGKSQIELNTLKDYNKILLQRDIAKNTKTLEKKKVKFTSWEPYGNYYKNQLIKSRDFILIIPPSLLYSEPYKSLISQGAKVIALSGKVMNASYRKEFKADNYIPFSDHCDINSLWKFVKDCNAKMIYLENGFMESFSYHLSRNGYNSKILTFT